MTKQGAHRTCAPFTVAVVSMCGGGVTGFRVRETGYCPTARKGSGMKPFGGAALRIRGRSLVFLRLAGVGSVFWNGVAFFGGGKDLQQDVPCRKTEKPHLERCGFAKGTTDRCATYSAAIDTEVFSSLESTDSRYASIFDLATVSLFTEVPPA